MGKKAIIQAGGAILLGLDVAIPMYLDAQGGFPNWNWQYHALIGFIAFCIFIGWVIFSKQIYINKLESGRPIMTLGNRVKAETVINEANSEMDIKTRILFRNSGTKNAYQLVFRAGIASAQDVSSSMALRDETSANLVAPNTDLEFGRDITLRQKYEISDNKRKFSGPTEWLIYSAVLYSDSPSKGKQYIDEWWFHYRFQGKDLQDATLEEKQKLEPYIRELFKTA